MREAIIRVRHHGAPESDISAVHPSVRMRSVSSMTGTTDERKRIIEIGGPPEDITAFLSEFRDAEAVIGAEPLSSLDATPVLVSMTYDSNQWDSISEKLQNLGVHYRTGTMIVAGWERWTLYLEDEDDLRKVIEVLEERGNDVDLVRNVSLEEVTPAHQLELSTLFDEFTERQYEVLSTAIHEGYYRDNDEITIEELADIVGLASSTTWEHLQRAEQKVMEEVGMALHEKPV